MNNDLISRPELLKMCAAEEEETGQIGTTRT